MSKVKTQIAYSAIKQKIIELKLPPLSDISEDKLQKELNISRTPIREAIQRLEQEGFVYIYPRKGTIVSEITTNLVKSVFETRELNEPFVFKDVCGKISVDWLLKIKGLFQDSKKEVSDKANRQFYIELDKELHTTVLNYSDNKFLKTMLFTVHDHDHRIRISTSIKDSNYKDSVKEHIDIIDALIKKDEDTIERLVREHIKRAKSKALQYLTY